MVLEILKFLLDGKEVVKILVLMLEVFGVVNIIFLLENKMDMIIYVKKVIY